MTRVKICGIAAGSDRDAAVEAGADALGFLVDVPVDTDRALTPDRAAALVEGVPPFVTTVLVTMPPDADHALELLDATGADVVQIHNDLAVEEVSAVAEATASSVIKATDADRRSVERYAPVADALLIDSRDESGAGGTGRRGDWATAAALREAVDRPVVLAGGLTTENVSEAVEAVRPYAVDVSTGVEVAEGRKDHEAVRSFVETVHRQPVSP